MADLKATPCPVCERGTFANKGCLVLDAMQVASAQRRWPWAVFGPGANDCPVCVQVPSEADHAK
jgi:hypothetical protein